MGIVNQTCPRFAGGGFLCVFSLTVSVLLTPMTALSLESKRVLQGGVFLDVLEHFPLLMTCISWGTLLACCLFSLPISISCVW